MSGLTLMSHESIPDLSVQRPEKRGSDILVGRMKSAMTNGDCVALKDRYTSLNAFCTY